MCKERTNRGNKLRKNNVVQKRHNTLVSKFVPLSSREPHYIYMYVCMCVLYLVIQIVNKRGNFTCYLSQSFLLHGTNTLMDDLTFVLDHMYSVKSASHFPPPFSTIPKIDGTAKTTRAFCVLYYWQ